MDKDEEENHKFDEQRDIENEDELKKLDEEDERQREQNHDYLQDALHNK